MKRAFAILAVLIVLFTGWYFASPRWVLREMAAAAEASDTERLSSHIDFPALRESMKAEMRAQMATELMGETDGMKGFGGMLAMGMVDRMVDAMATPEMMRNAFASKGSSSKQASGAFKFDNEGTEFVRDSFDQFRLRHANRPDLVFGRRGLGWKLVGVRAVSSAPFLPAEQRSYGDGDGVATVSSAPFSPAEQRLIDENQRLESLCREALELNRSGRARSGLVRWIG